MTLLRNKNGLVKLDAIPWYLCLSQQRLLYFSTWWFCKTCKTDEWIHDTWFYML